MTSPDPRAIQQARRLAAGLVSHSRANASAVRAPDLLACLYDAGGETFHVLYADLTSADVQLGELTGGLCREVAAWSVDEFRRGVQVVFDDGSGTSFSAEFPRYLRDSEYRRRVDDRAGPDGEDLGQRVAARVREERERRGWSVAELARRAEMATPNLHRVESGKHVPTMPTVLRLAVALQVPLERLVRHGKEKA